jgi:hypothetical protein
MDEREMMRRWVETWKQAEPELERIRLEEIAKADNNKDLAALEDVFNDALRSQPPEPSSGLVEMQAWFAKLRR